MTTFTPPNALIPPLHISTEDIIETLYQSNMSRIMKAPDFAASVVKYHIYEILEQVIALFETKGVHIQIRTREQMPGAKQEHLKVNVTPNAINIDIQFDPSSIIQTQHAYAVWSSSLLELIMVLEGIALKDSFVSTTKMYSSNLLALSILVKNDMSEIEYITLQKNLHSQVASCMIAIIEFLKRIYHHSCTAWYKKKHTERK